jgi:uncharacterized protein (TIGR02271 family)
MDRINEQWNIPEGVEVFGAEGDKVGKIVAVHPSYVVVEKGFFFPTDYYIPRTAIANFDGENAYLAVSKEQALNQEWSEAPIDDFSVGQTGPTTGGAYAAETTSGTTEADVSGMQHRTGGTTEYADTGDTLRVPVYEEELVATKRPREMGDVQISKDVLEEERTMEVPVTEERVRVTRRAVDRDAGTGEFSFEEGTIDVPVRGEAVDVQKRTRVAEEVEVAKEQVERTERVGGTVRKERVRVDETGEAGRAADELSARETSASEELPPA